GLQVMKVLKEPLLYYFISGLILGILFIRYAKQTAAMVNDYSTLSDFETILDTVSIFFRTVFDFYTFDAKEPFTSVYAYLLIPVIVYLIFRLKKIKLNHEERKVVLIFLVDAFLIFSAIMVSHWTAHNFVPRRYFTCTYISVSFFSILLFDNLQGKANELKNTKVYLLVVVLIGSIGTIYNLKYVWPKRLSPMVELTSEWQDLGEIGIIAEYWNSYMVSCTDPDQLAATPHDKAEVKNYEFVEQVFNKEKIYINRDMWMESFPDTLHQFGRTLVKKGPPIFIGDSHACEYTLME
ncbi:MAG: hypothetical protein JW801_18210, partial [Bacteroidales bacterium]|nr:hypothetical protein [Bacteroidales bacterium]